MYATWSQARTLREDISRGYPFFFFFFVKKGHKHVFFTLYDVNTLVLTTRLTE